MKRLIEWEIFLICFYGYKISDLVLKGKVQEQRSFLNPTIDSKSSLYRKLCQPLIFYAIIIFIYFWCKISETISNRNITFDVKALAIPSRLDSAFTFHQPVVSGECNKCESWLKSNRLSLSAVVVRNINGILYLFALQCVIITMRFGMVEALIACHALMMAFKRA